MKHFDAKKLFKKKAFKNFAFLRFKIAASTYIHAKTRSMLSKIHRGINQKNLKKIEWIRQKTQSGRN